MFALFRCRMNAVFARTAFTGGDLGGSDGIGPFVGLGRVKRDVLTAFKRPIPDNMTI
jgi:hypothetical protein